MLPGSHASNPGQLGDEIVFYLVFLIIGVRKIGKKHGKHLLITKIGVIMV
jgi:hypothetical protein